MKNPYKKHVNIFIRSSKHARVNMNRRGDEVYITDGYTALRLSYPLYEEFVRPLGVIFPPLADGEFAVKTPENLFPTVTIDGCDLSRFFTQEFTEPADPLNLYINLPGRMGQLISTNHKLFAYNIDYIEAVRDYLPTEPITATFGRWPTLFIENDYSAAIILPINDNGAIADAIANL